MLPTSFLLIKSLNKTETPDFLIRGVFFVSKGNLYLGLFYQTAYPNIINIISECILLQDICTCYVVKNNLYDFTVQCLLTLFMVHYYLSSD